MNRVFIKILENYGKPAIEFIEYRWGGTDRKLGDVFYRMSGGWIIDGDAGLRLEDYPSISIGLQPIDYTHHPDHKFVSKEDTPELLALIQKIRNKESVSFEDISKFTI